jgi:hypothetical protein
MEERDEGGRMKVQGQWALARMKTGADWAYYRMARAAG